MPEFSYSIIFSEKAQYLLIIFFYLQAMIFLIYCFI